VQRKVADIYVHERYPAATTPTDRRFLPRHEKIRIGYFSADFRNHAIAYLIAGLFELHDRNRFEVSAFSFSPNTDDEMRARLSRAADRFLDVHAQSDGDVAELAKKLELDIAIDLTGFTAECRLGVFSLRAAPIQVNYLGYPGTMAAECIDYVVADSTVIPEADRRHYVEKIVYLPDSYQVNDSKRAISDKTFTREELGLPQTGFVFCCFNNSYKILPEVFECWMRILTHVEGSVLWLIRDSETAVHNLRREAQAKGVSANRLVFAKRMPLADHLARHRLADLFIDTLPYNAHTTASDALWAGLPVLTRIGETFAGRVAASLLRAIDLPELITATQEEYEHLAIALATNPGRLQQLKYKLKRNRLTTPLFNTALFTRHIEAAYMMMYERQRASLPPTHLWPT
jgi:predicted O-linked N-acetylglucosamine transferase (SPINDLY family)